MQTAQQEPVPNDKTRARRDSKSTNSPSATRIKPFPTAPKSSIKHGSVPQEQFWAYRKALPVDFHDRMVFYVYRDWPVLDVYRTCSQEDLAAMRAKKKRDPIKYIAKYADIDPDDWRNHLLRFHGSGVYKINLNDSGVRGREGEICRTVVELRDNEFSPVVDLDILDMADPANASFINDLRMKGITLPGDLPKNEGTDDMASSVAVETLANALVEQSKTKQAPPPPVDNTAATMLSDLLRQSEARHLKELELAEQRHTRELDALTKRMEAQEKSVQDRGRDPLETTRSVIEMAKQVSSPAVAPDNKMVDILMQLLKSTEERAIQDRKLDADRHAQTLEALNRRLEAQEKRAADLEAARLAQPATQSKSAIQEAISLVKALRGATDELAGDAGGGTGNPYVDAAMELGPKLFDTITTVASTFRNTPPAPAQQQASQQPGIAAQQPQPTALTAEEQMVERIKAQLLQALGQNMNGAMFGGGIMFEYGDMVYNHLRNLGENGLMTMCQQNPEYWAQIQRVGARVPQFLAEFLDGAAVIERFQAIQAGQGRGPVAQSQPSPAASSRPAPRANCSRRYSPVIITDPPAAVPLPAQQQGGRTIIKEGGPVKVNGPVVDGTV